MSFGYTVLGFGASSGTPPTELGIASNANNLNIKTLTLAAGGTVDNDVIVTIDNGVTIGSSAFCNACFNYGHWLVLL